MTVTEVELTLPVEEIEVVVRIADDGVNGPEFSATYRRPGDNTVHALPVEVRVEVDNS